MSEEDLREQLKGAIKSRALFYLAVYREMAAEFGPERAEGVMKRAIYKRGVAAGDQFKRYAPDDFAGLRDAFIDFVPDHGGMFQPEVRKCANGAGGGLEIKFHACPLKEVWQEAGLAESEVADMCRIAGVVDNGTFESAGFAIQSQTWTPGDSGCCLLKLSPAKT
ncbi:MAG: L-2-amino-thiazoline-4-carboxylic acid hydrolase [Proteobacteria bacterium]|nr:L-2-amino-thiazoline-4-carboxylic acid hydrolase [Pseudomonadota bacterium]